MSQYVKLSEGWFDGSTPAKVAKVAKDDPALAGLAVLAGGHAQIPNHDNDPFASLKDSSRLPSFKLIKGGKA